jgi:Protein of unknown function (DUF2948)
LADAVKPLKLLALDEADLAILSAAAQDGIFVVKDADWRPKARRFSLALQRFCWERAHDGGHKGERVGSVLAFEGVLSVKAHKVAQAKPDAFASLLSIQFQAGPEAPGGVITLELAGHGAIALEVECIDAALIDLAAPRPAVAKPDHKL